ncbi:MAG: hypothetical protein Unbinned7865contig1001_65 [Prokaryotic dsDNA virus sp.]|nr:MAG: hypothetical protein Unbinned7865contig1001_65 [Prokaryotic dsDNA virus sp.]|tara:strand:- start:11384 stop:11764 length:381 start_codon:yes stop_codon:yes gene_type:complete
MAMTVAQIAAKAYTAVAAKITDAIHNASLTYDTQGAYDFDTGEYALTPVTATGRAVVDTVKPVADIFPDYIAGPGDELILLEGFTSCKENYRLTISGDTWHIGRVQDIVAAGSLFYVVARRAPDAS